MNLTDDTLLWVQRDKFPQVSGLTDKPLCLDGGNDLVSALSFSIKKCLVVTLTISRGSRGSRGSIY